MISENGVSGPEEDLKGVKDAVRDLYRIRYYRLVGARAESGWDGAVQEDAGEMCLCFCVRAHVCACTQVSTCVLM